ncbi:hypothetical protein [Streptomyces collinus]
MAAVGEQGAVALINAATRMKVIVHRPGGSYERGMFDSMSG